MNIDWDSYLDVQNGTVDEMWEKFKLALVQGMNRFISKGSKCMGKYEKNFQPFNKELQQLINKKHKLWKGWLSSRDNDVLKTDKATRNRVKKHTYNIYNRFMALWMLSGTTQMSQYQKKHSPTHTHPGQLVISEKSEKIN